ncbi:hypothetical protein Q5752_006427 [Cryptotrichosporon argae]
MNASVAWIGLGAMGAGMAGSLLSQSFSVSAYDVYAPFIKRVVQAGATASSSPAHAVQGASTVGLMVVNADQVEDVLFGAGEVAQSLAPGSVVVCFSTVPPSFLASVAARLAVKDIGFVDAPVSGGFVRAAEGQLSVMVAGTTESIERARPVLEALTRAPNGKLTVVGDKAGAASDFKLINQVLCAIHIAVSGEAMALGVNMGANPRKLYEAVREGPGASWMFTNRVPWQLEPSETPKSAITIIHKDSGIVMDEARSYGLYAPVSAAAEQVFSAALGAGLGRIDDGCVNVLWERFGGKPVAQRVTNFDPAEQAKAEETVTALLEGVHLLSAAEALVFARRKKMDVNAVYDVVSKAAAASNMLSTRGRRILAGDRSVHSPLRVLHARVSKVIEEAKKTNTPLFLATAVHQALTLAVQNGWSDEDDSAVVRLWGADQ